jgi:hypothetical protein
MAGCRSWVRLAADRGPGWRPGRAGRSRPAGERPVPLRRGPSWAGVRPAGPCRLVTAGPAYRGRGWSVGAVAERRRIGAGPSGDGRLNGRPARPPQRHGGDGRQVRRSESCLPSAHDAGHRRSDVTGPAACYVDYSASPLCGQLHDGTQPDMPMSGWVASGNPHTLTCRCECIRLANGCPVALARGVVPILCRSVGGGRIVGGMTIFTSAHQVCPKGQENCSIEPREIVASSAMQKAVEHGVARMIRSKSCQAWRHSWCAWWSCPLRRRPGR